MTRRRPKKELAIEEQESLIARLKEAITVGELALTKLKHEDLQVAAVDLDDATEDMNDAIRAAQKAFRDHEIPSARVYLDADRALVWNGAEFLIETNRAGARIRSLLSCSRKDRVDGCGKIPELLHPPAEQWRRPRSGAVEIVRICKGDLWYLGHNERGAPQFGAVKKEDARVCLSKDSAAALLGTKGFEGAEVDVTSKEES